MPRISTENIKSTKALMRTLFSFELIFVLFIFAGRFKADPRLSWIPFDLTVFFYVLSLIIGLALLLKRRRLLTRNLIALLLMLLFSSWLVSTLSWTPMTEYALIKAIKIFLFITWSFAVGVLIIGPDLIRLRKFIWLIYMFSFVVALETIRIHTTSSDVLSLKEVFGGTYLGAGRIVANGLVISAMKYLAASHVLHKAIHILLASIFFMALILVGSRGPFIFALLTIVVAFFTYGRKGIFHLLLIAIGGIFFGMGLLSSTDHNFLTLQRLLYLQEGVHYDTSTSGRIDRINFALSQINRSPIIGEGIGSFYANFPSAFPERDYAHNLFLELWGETGAIALALLLALFLMAAINLLNAKNFLYYEHHVIVWLLMNAFLNAMVSGDVTDNRFLFALLGVVNGIGGAVRRDEKDG